MTSISNPEKAKAFIRDCARELGFDAISFTAAHLEAEAGHNLRQFVEQDHHGDMHWMAARMDLRSAPQALWPEARTAIILAMNYAPDANPLPRLKEKGRGNISVYAEGKDYHDLIKGRLKTLASKIVSRYGGDVKVFVDTAPVMEKPLAANSSIGWQGKHTCIVSREYGSWLFLGEIFTTLELPPDPAETDHCGSCTRCMDICPTNAFTNTREIDARRCISYLTIEHKGQIPIEFRKAMGNRIYGCDDCLAICPWNKFAKQTQQTELLAKEELKTMPKLEELLTLDDAAFRKLFRKTPVIRIGRDRFIRNCLIAAGNSENPELLPLIAPLQQDSSPLVQDMARWAMTELRA